MVQAFKLHSVCKLLIFIMAEHTTIFATFSCHHRQKCSVSCNSCERRFSPTNRNRPHGAQRAGM